MQFDGRWFARQRSRLQSQLKLLIEFAFSRWVGLVIGTYAHQKGLNVIWYVGAIPVHLH